MTLAPSIIGIDVSKDWLDIFDAATGTPQRLANRPGEIARFAAALPAGSRVVFEATAPYDAALRQCLQAHDLHVRRINPARARDFARYAGFLAKTDSLDARMLAEMAGTKEIKPQLAFDTGREALIALHRRRDQLVETRAVERGRIRDVADACERASLERHLQWLDGEIKDLDAKLHAALQSPGFAKTAKLLRSAKGVGEITVATLLALLPELGQCSSKAIAALAGLAPLNCDSGRSRGQRHIHGGRVRVRRALYMAALSAIRGVPRFKAYYEAIRARSGHAKVAIIAVARKLLVALNAIVKSGQPFRL